MSRLPMMALALAAMAPLAVSVPAYAGKKNKEPSRLEMPAFEVRLADADGGPVSRASVFLEMNATGRTVNDCYLNVGRFFECIGANIIFGGFGGIDMHFTEQFARYLSADWHRANDSGVAVVPERAYERFKHDRTWVPGMRLRVWSLGLWPIEHPTRPGVEVQCERIYWGPMDPPYIRATCEPLDAGEKQGVEGILKSISAGIDCRLSIGTNELEAWIDRGLEICRETVIRYEENNGPLDPANPVSVYPNE